MQLLDVMSVNATTIREFSPPGNLDELTPANRTRWSRDFISKWMDDEIEGNQSGREPLPQFFNGTITAYEIDQAGVNIVWKGFPNRVMGITSLMRAALTCYRLLFASGIMMKGVGWQPMPVEMFRMNI